MPLNAGRKCIKFRATFNHRSTTLQARTFRLSIGGANDYFTFHGVLDRSSVVERSTTYRAEDNATLKETRRCETAKFARARVLIESVDE